MPAGDYSKFKMTVRNLPSWVAVWLCITTTTVTIDSLFILLRPHTLPGGKWNYLFQPYNLYIQVDPIYKDTNDAFGIGQTLMNLVEVFINIITVIMHVRGKSSLAVLLAFMVSVMTLAKTVLYMLICTPLCGGQHFVNYPDLKKLILAFILPNSFWILVPFLCVVATGRIMLEYMESGETKAKKLKSR
ncbi:hypothetical protein ACROYT_G018244 [Oculina patagonica]